MDLVFGYNNVKSVETKIYGLSPALLCTYSRYTVKNNCCSVVYNIHINSKINIIPWLLKYNASKTKSNNSKRFACTLSLRIGWLNIYKGWQNDDIVGDIIALQ